MQDQPTIVAKRHTPTPETGERRRSRTTLPPHLLAEARRRLGLLATLFAALLLLDVLFALDLADEQPLLLLSDLGALTLAVVVALLAFWRRASTAVVLNAGLIFEVALCYLFSIAWTHYYYEARGMIPLMGWVAPIIIVFPLVVPTPPAKSLVASLAAATAPPVGAMLLAATGLITLEPIVLSGSPIHPALATFWSPFIAVIIAWFASRWLYGMRLQLAKAHELGSYRLVTLLGRGGMGEVWRARHRLLARPAAIKLIRPDMLATGDVADAERVIRRFEREAQATAAMCSPHTIQVYDFGVSQEGDFYYVMELLDGLGCDALVSRFGALPPARAVHILRQVCDSLAEAHAAELIHRDVKPANVFVCRYGRQVDFAKVLDFGLVKPQRETRADVRLTAEHVPGGTPAFMAPEQIIGKRALDARTDLYAVGGLGYWLITAQLPFEGSTPMEIMTQHVHNKPVPPSERTGRAVPRSLEGLILACLEKDLELRPASADALSDELEACEVAPAWTSAMAREWWDTHVPSGMGEEKAETVPTLSP